MPLLILNTPVTIYRKGKSNSVGEALEGDGIPMKVAVVTLNDTSSQTPIRSQQAASAGRASIDLANVKLLFAPGAEVKMGDRVQLYDLSLRIINVFPRANMFGRRDRGHLEVTLARMEV